MRRAGVIFSDDIPVVTILGETPALPCAYLTGVLSFKAMKAKDVANEQNEKVFSGLTSSGVGDGVLSPASQ